MKTPHLTILAAVPVWNDRDSLVFDRKFYDGVLMYAQLWPGDITCILSATRTPPPAFGLVTKKPEELPFKCTVLGEKERVDAEHLQGSSVVLASGDLQNQFHVSALCERLKIKCVYSIEYIPQTRYQIASLSTTNPIRKLRRFLYVWCEERGRRAAFRRCHGLQSNGTPAHDEYSAFRNNMLYFDTRVYRANMIGGPELEERLDVLAQGKPLRLAFSGRLAAMKGADHLVSLAELLRERKVPAHLSIYGAGELEGEMKEHVRRSGLEEFVSMPGSVDFYEKLLPALKAKTDLFVCLHRQSDPSCTYLETLSCGVPIVGYKNRAFAGLLAAADIGWGAELNDLAEAARLIEGLEKRRAEIAEKSRAAAAFARLHDFESMFRDRVNHLLGVAGE